MLNLLYRWTNTRRIRRLDVIAQDLVFMGFDHPDNVQALLDDAKDAIYSLRFEMEKEIDREHGEQKS